MFKITFTFSIFILIIGQALMAYADTRTNVLDPARDPRGEPELTVCSQNLENYGSYPDSLSRDSRLSSEDYRQKERALLRRFVSKGCDVIAVQEVLGKTDEAAGEALQVFANKLRLATGRTFDTKVGPTLDKFSHVGYLVARDRATISNWLSYSKIELPKLTDKQKPRYFVRVPVEIQLSVKPHGEGSAKNVTLVNFHFKSKRGSGTDPAELEWETHRMEMAEAIRRIVANRHAQSFQTGETILVLLGDRNSHFDAASAKILDGTLSLKAFQGTAPCRLSKRGVPLCQAGIAGAPKFFSVLTGDPETKQQPGTIHYKKEYSWVDDILMPTESLRFAWRTFESNGNYESGVVYVPPEASDHGMIWVRLNW